MERIKEAFLSFIHIYEVEPEEYAEAEKRIRLPHVLMFQILWWVYGHFFWIPTMDITRNTLEKIADALWIGFGGVLLYYMFSAIMMIVTALLYQRSIRIICLVLGILGTIWTFSIL